MQLPGNAQPETNSLTVASIYTDHMVVQQNSEVKIWGTSRPGERVSINASWDSKSLEADADAEGKWMGTLATPDAGGPFEIIVKAGDEAKTFSDLYSGEVWLASGQSNMEMPLKGWPPHEMIRNSEKELEQADYPRIRMFTVARAMSDHPQSHEIGRAHV